MIVTAVYCGVLLDERYAALLEPVKRKLASAIVDIRQIRESLDQLEKQVDPVATQNSLTIERRDYEGSRPTQVDEVEWEVRMMSMQGQIRRLRRYEALLWLLGVVGVLMAGGGFYFWYTLFQRHQDKEVLVLWFKAASAEDVRTAMSQHRGSGYEQSKSAIRVP